MPQTIRLHGTTGNNPPTGLIVREPSVELGPITRLWVNAGGGDPGNRLLLSSDTTDGALGTAGFLPTAGGTMTGPINVVAPTLATHAASMGYVDAMIANMRLFLGTWEVDNNVPQIPTGNESAGDYYIAVTQDPTVPETADGGIPGIGGALIHNGDLILWNATNAEFDLVRGGPLTVAEADQLYLGLGGGTLTGALILAGNAQANLEPVTLQQFNAGLALYLPLAGGVLTGELTLDGPPTQPLHPVTMAYAHGEFLPITGTVTGVVNTSATGNFSLASGAVFAITAGQINLQGPSTFNNTVTLGQAPTLDMHAANKQYVDSAVGGGFSGVAVSADGSLIGNGLVGQELEVAMVDGGEY